MEIREMEGEKEGKESIDKNWFREGRLFYGTVCVMRMNW
jgi:hypothetical protein